MKLRKNSIKLFKQASTTFQTNIEIKKKLAFLRLLQNNRHKFARQNRILVDIIFKFNSKIINSKATQNLKSLWNSLHLLIGIINLSHYNILIPSQMLITLTLKNQMS